MSRYRVEIDNEAIKQIKKLDRPIRERVLAAIEALADDPRPDGCVKLKPGKLNLYRIRVGAYRIRYEVQDGILLVLVLKAGPPGQVYDDL
ncbi:hypothetical protein BJF83_15295 [Nocardiopsis sp. CNR-923]|uniref:type II toxin-antitoxin system RelE family toxin n=1 Tax=Nocardiopsis sp. CNR-923 TaxID=1904965 RepID=UPI0009683164|nr:type II toxin-antitoxin system RelE/ParE family toxin [Nocardiopsis sp. CNR-923]OLT28391.1 hypothetical protein BJF83_15295 [Nocardiopsis sp. CNR-923]